MTDGRNSGCRSDSVSTGIIIRGNFECKKVAEIATDNLNTSDPSLIILS